MATLIPDSIDFSGYLNDTDHAHKVRPAGSFADDVVAYFHDPRGPLGDKLPWPKTHGLIRFRPGEVTLWGGMNGHGKSLALGQVCLGLITQGKMVCIASMEMRPAITLARICRQAFGDNRPDAEFIQEFSGITNRRLWFYDQQGSVKTEKMLAVIRYCADQIKVNHFVIDSLMKCGMGEDDYNGQKAFVDALTVIARDYGVHIHLIAHSRKGRDEFAPPGKMDVKGTGAITDQVDNVLTCWRNKPKERELQEGKADKTQDPDALLIIDKQRNGEWEGKIGLWFHPSSMQFVENGISGPMDMLTQEKV
jgi:twinkle protein